MEWLSQDFQGLHFDTQAINETSSSWGLTRRNEEPDPKSIIRSVVSLPCSIDSVKYKRSRAGAPMGTKSFKMRDSLLPAKCL